MRNEVSEKAVEVGKDQSEKLRSNAEVRVIWDGGNTFDFPRAKEKMLDIFDAHDVMDFVTGVTSTEFHGHEPVFRWNLKVPVEAGDIPMVVKTEGSEIEAKSMSETKMMWKLLQPDTENVLTAPDHELTFETTDVNEYYRHLKMCMDERNFFYTRREQHATRRARAMRVFVGVLGENAYKTIRRVLREKGIDAAWKELCVANAPQRNYQAITILINEWGKLITVSYTHLTLPTICSV